MKSVYNGFETILAFIAIISETISRSAKFIMTGLRRIRLLFSAF